jgi:hypothetical protein
VLALLQQLKQADSTLQERNLVIVQLNSLLAHHLRRNEKEDRFYKDARKEMDEVRCRLTIQELIIDEY